MSNVNQIFQGMLQDNYVKTDKFFAKFMVVQWLFLVAISWFVTPYTWIGNDSSIHIHVIASIVLGGLISIMPILLSFKH